jgi:hypothetical protein
MLDKPGSLARVFPRRENLLSASGAKASLRISGMSTSEATASAICWLPMDAQNPIATD